MRRRLSRCHSLLAIPLLGLAVAARPGALAQEPTEAAGPATQPAPASIERYLGTWTLSAEIQGNPVQMTLEIAPVADTVKAALRAPIRPEAQLIESVEATDAGIDLAYDAELGGNTARIHIEATLEAGKLVGTFGDEGGFFSADFSGERAAQPANIVSAAVAAAAEDQGRASRQRRRFGGTAEARLDLGDATVRILYAPLELDSADGQSFLLTETGDAFTYPGGRVMKLLTGTDLHFADITIAAHNFSPDYPGAYGVWLKKAEDGWHLVFNRQPDVWGTMYDPDYDVATVPLQVSRLDSPVEELRVELAETGQGGTLRISWGDTLWSARFTTG